MYAALIPGFVYEDFLTQDFEGILAWEEGGLFHDSRARDLFDQVGQPFFDPVEMNFPDAAALAGRSRGSEYSGAFRKWVGEEVRRDDARLNYHAFRALVEFLREPMFRSFDSRLDDFLAGEKSALNARKKRGLKVYRGAGRCVDRHFPEPTNWEEPLLSDFGDDNLGAPSRGEKDPGVGTRTGEEEIGQFRAPGSRKVALSAPHTHNGSIAMPREVVEFHNKREVEPARWGETDYPETVNREDMGDLQPTDEEVADLVASLETGDVHGPESARDEGGGDVSRGSRRRAPGGGDALVFPGLDASIASRVSGGLGPGGVGGSAAKRRGRRKGLPKGEG